MMRSSSELVNLFFHDLKQYNSTNFKILERADVVNEDDPVLYKAFSSVITRYFIFREKHPEISLVEHNILYFKLKLDLIAKYFADYPDNSKDSLKAFQIELQSYVESNKEE